MILPFLPEGSYAILINYMLHPEEPARHGECHNCSWTMEAELWRHVRHVRKMYYQVSAPARRCARATSHGSRRPIRTGVGPAGLRARPPRAQRGGEGRPAEAGRHGRNGDPRDGTVLTT